MCGGWRTTDHDYSPTPQPGNFVKVWVCKVCNKRARRAKILVERKFIRTPHTRLRMRYEGQEFARRKSFDRSIKTIVEREVELGSCCHRTTNHIRAMGKVERTVWSKDRHKVPSKFFFIVYVPILEKRIWVHLEAHIELVAAHEFLIHNVPED